MTQTSDLQDLWATVRASVPITEEATDEHVIKLIQSGVYPGDDLYPGPDPTELARKNNALLRKILELARKNRQLETQCAALEDLLRMTISDRVKQS